MGLWNNVGIGESGKMETKAEGWGDNQQEWLQPRVDGNNQGAPGCEF